MDQIHLNPDCLCQQKPRIVGKIQSSDKSLLCFGFLSRKLSYMIWHFFPQHFCSVSWQCVKELDGFYSNKRKLLSLISRYILKMIQHFSSSTQPNPLKAILFLGIKTHNPLVFSSQTTKMKVEIGGGPISICFQRLGYN